MRLQFLYSKIKEKEKLLNIYEEYQWFIDNDFPIVLPKFYAEIYQENENDKKTFAKKLDRELNKIYNKNDHLIKQKKIKNNWQKIERDFFSILNDFTLNIKNKYICYISLYGPQGQYQYPNIIDLRIAKQSDVKEANVTIAHEIIHLIIKPLIDKQKLDYETLEGLVDLFFKETNLKRLFPIYRVQSIGKISKDLFQKNISKSV